MAADLILALDIGSSSIRAGLVDGHAVPLPRTLVKLGNSFLTTADGGSEMDADVCFDKVVAAIDGVLSKSPGRRGEIAAVASCSFWHSLLGIDERGRPTTPVLGWADTRSRLFSSVLKKRFDEKTVHGRTGTHFHSSFWPAKLLWLQTQHPDAFARTKRWLSFADYVTLRLCGDAATSISMASGTGMFDQLRCDWDAELTKFLKVGLKTPTVAQAPLNLSRKFAAKWPRLKNARWLPPIGDGAADHLGSCGLARQKASLMVGTSAAMRVAYKGEPPKQLPDGLWCYRIDRQRVIAGGALSDGGNLYERLARALKVPKDAERQMRTRGAAAHGLTVIPFFFGERSTGYRENARGSIRGLNASHDSVDILQAAMESVAFRLAEIHDRLKRVANIKEIVASGGALRDSPVWTQIIADVLGRDLTVSDTSESSLRGVVLLALESLGKIESIDSFSTPAASTLAFHPECHKAYKAARKRHREFDKTISK